MDSTVIQEVANQLGIAVDQAGQFIAEQLPNFAALQVVKVVSSLTIATLVFFILLAGTIISFNANTRSVESYNNDKENPFMRAERYDFASFFLFISFAVICGVAAIVLLVLLFANVPEIIGWANYPEAMLIDKALAAIK